MFQGYERENECASTQQTPYWEILNSNFTYIINLPVQFQLKNLEVSNVTTGILIVSLYKFALFLVTCNPACARIWAGVSPVCVGTCTWATCVPPAFCWTAKCCCCWRLIRAAISVSDIVRATVVCLPPGEACLMNYKEIKLNH